MPDSGLEEIYLNDFSNMGQLDGTVLDRLVDESNNLQKLSVIFMAFEETSNHNRKELEKLTIKILEARPPLTHLDLRYFSEEKSQGEKLM